MKTIQLLQSAATISIAIGKENAHNINNNQVSSNNNNNNQQQHHHHHLRSRHLQLQNVTCAANETPCHVETDVAVACAKEGEMCPCYFNERQCHDPHFGDYCDFVCCEWGVQERCSAPNLDDPTITDIFCATITDGGCPCPPGETRCGTQETDGGFTGSCTPVCCDTHNNNEQTCYDANYNPSYCARIDEGGCPCPEGKVRCNGGSEEDDWAGSYCTEVCCGEEEEVCFDDLGRGSCGAISLGGCSSHTSYEFWNTSSRLMSSTILAEGTGGQVLYYWDIVDRKNKLLLLAYSSEGERLRRIKHLEAEEAALFHAIRMKVEGLPLPPPVKGGEITSIS